MFRVFTLFNLEGTEIKKKLKKKRTLNGGLAQLGERLPCKQEVTGSIPVLSTTRQGLEPKRFEDGPETEVSAR